MTNRFKKMRGIDLSYRRQGDIFFTCLNYAGQSKRIKQKIIDLCREIGGEDYEQALFNLLTTERSVSKIALDSHCSETTLYVLRKRFYERW